MSFDPSDGASPHPLPGAAQTLWQGTPGAGDLLLSVGGATGHIKAVPVPAGAAVSLGFTPAAVGPIWTPTPSSLAFGGVTVGQRSALSVVVTNTGDAPLSVDSEPISGTGNAFFSRAPGTNVNAQMVAPGASVSYAFIFAPLSVGQQTARANFVTSLGNKLIELTGTGVAPLPPPGIKNVREYGALGTGAIDDTAAVQRAVDAAGGGETVWFPAGTYHLAGPVNVFKSGVTFEGEGVQSVLKFDSIGLQIGPSGHPVGLTVSKLHFWGKPGFYQTTGNGATAIMGEMANLNTLPAGAALTVSDCDFTGCGWGYRSGGGSTVLGDGSRWAVKVTNCRWHGWGVCPFFLLSGEVVEGCTLIQDDPGQQSSHGFYIHAGAKDVHVRDTTITNARKWGVQVWCQYPNAPIDGVTLERLTLNGCSGGIIIARSEILNMAIRNVTVSGCTINQTVSDALHVSTGVNISGSDNVIDRAANGLVLDGPKGELTNAVFARNAIRNCGVGVLAQPSPATGAFTDVRIQGSVFSGNGANVNLQGASGISVS